MNFSAGGHGSQHGRWLPDYDCRWRHRGDRRAHPKLGLEGGTCIHGMSGEAKGQAVVGIAGFYWLASLGLAFSRL